ncbi:unnamed protein product, partial [Choristocarpus tenellus]
MGVKNVWNRPTTAPVPLGSESDKQLILGLRREVLRLRKENLALRSSIPKPPESPTTCSLEVQPNHHKTFASFTQATGSKVIESLQEALGSWKSEDGDGHEAMDCGRPTRQEQG